MGIFGGLGNLSSGLGAFSSIANAQNSISNSQNSSVSDSWNYGGSQSASQSYANSDAWSAGWSAGRSQASEQSTSQTFGAEASARDVQYAQEANALQQKLWQQQADYNAQQAQIDRDYQTYMSNTAYQRAVKDLLAAGLNPILAAGNMGASTPVGAMATSGLSSAYKASSYADQYAQSSGESSSWNKSKNKSKSKSRSASSSYSSSYESGGSHSESEGSSKSRTKTQLKSLIDAVAKYLNNGGSASNHTTNYDSKTGREYGGHQTK